MLLIRSVDDVGVKNRWYLECRTCRQIHPAGRFFYPVRIKNLVADSFEDKPQANDRANEDD